MQLNSILTVTGIAGAALVIGYYAGSHNTQNSESQFTPANPVHTENVAAHPPINTAMTDPLPPASSTTENYHQTPPASGPAALPPQQGRAHSADVDPDAKFTHFRVGQRNVKQIYADGDVMWVGTSGGVIRYNIKTDEYKLFDSRNGLLANGVFHISKLGDDIVVGTYGGGMSILNQSTQEWKTYNIPQGLGDAFVYDVLKADNGDIWIATWSGANRIRGGKLDDRSQWDLFTVENTDGGLPNDWVYGLAMGKNGEVWMATEGGLARYLDGKWDNWNHDNGQGADYELVKSQIKFNNDPAQYSKHHTRQKTEMGLEQVDIAYNPNYIVALLVDDDGTVWAGTWGGGLAHFDGESWKNYTVHDGLPANHIFSLYQDPQGQLWVGSSDGLALRNKDGSFRVFNTFDGLFSNTVFAMETASDGSNWIGSFGGVARIASLQ
jgi:ligand-binding sensor domain-containing protein